MERPPGVDGSSGPGPSAGAEEPRAVSPGRAVRRRRRAVARSAGATLLVAGLAVFSMAAWNLWGTGIGTAKAQRAPRAQLEAAYPERPSIGDPVGIIQIPRIGLDAAFVEGAADEDLALGPGHYPDSPLPGQGGNVTIAGHRTTHSAPFWSLDVLVPGD